MDLMLTGMMHCSNWTVDVDWTIINYWSPASHGDAAQCCPAPQTRQHLWCSVHNSQRPLDIEISCVYFLFSIIMSHYWDWTEMVSFTKVYFLSGYKNISSHHLAALCWLPLHSDCRISSSNIHCSTAACRHCQLSGPVHCTE